MVDYNPNVPANGAENISISQPKITNNFQQLNTIFAEDHHTWNDATASKRGKHTKITFPTPLAVDPATSTLTCSLYSKADVADESGRPQLFCQNINGPNNVRQITNRFINSVPNDGYLMLPNGLSTVATHRPIIIMWGSTLVIEDNSNQNYEIQFPEITNYAYPGDPGDFGFPYELYNFQFSMIANNISDNLTASPLRLPLAVINSGVTINPNGRQYMNVLVSGRYPAGRMFWFAIGN